jgi:glutaredoxin
MDLLDKKQIVYKEVKIDNNDNEKRFLKSQGFRTVPQIYNELGEHIGGFTDLKEYFENGEDLL